MRIASASRGKTGRKSGHECI